MKSLDELNKIKEEAREDMKFKKDQEQVIVNIAMGTCGIAAGAREVLNVISNELEEKEIDNVDLNQIGCIGLCTQEPIVEVNRLGQKSVTYGKVSTEEAKRIVNQHIIGGEIVEDLIID